MNSSHDTHQGMDVESGVKAASGLTPELALKNSYRIVCRDRDTGEVRWVEEFDNLVTTAGLNDNLDKYLKGSGYSAAWYVGLTDGAPTVAAGDTMGSHAGWVEVTAYDEAARPALVLGSVSAGSVDNSGNEATFTIDTNGTTIGGAFLCSDATKGGSAGVLYSVAAFSGGNKTIGDNDVLDVTVTCTAAST